MTWMNSSHRNLQLLALSALPMSLKASIFYTSAGATTFTTTPVSFAIDSGTFGPGVSGNFFDLATGNNKPSLNPHGTGEIILTSQTGGGFGASENFAVRLGAGETIDSSAPWGSGSGYLSKPGYAGTINSGDRGYLGLRIANGGGYNYGWADISHNADESVTLHAFAMETTVNTPILAGAGVTAVPEPAETAFAAAVAAGSVAAFRARRRMQSRRAAGR